MDMNLGPSSVPRDEEEEESPIEEETFSLPENFPLSEQMNGVTPTDSPPPSSSSRGKKKKSKRVVREDLPMMVDSSSDEEGDSTSSHLDSLVKSLAPPLPPPRRRAEDEMMFAAGISLLEGYVGEAMDDDPQLMETFGIPLRENMMTLGLFIMFAVNSSARQGGSSYYGALHAMEDATHRPNPILIEDQQDLVAVVRIGVTQRQMSLARSSGMKARDLVAIHVLHRMQKMHEQTLRQLMEHGTKTTRKILKLLDMGWGASSYNVNVLNMSEKRAKEIHFPPDRCAPLSSDNERCFQTAKIIRSFYHRFTLSREIGLDGEEKPPLTNTHSMNFYVREDGDPDDTNISEEDGKAEFQGDTVILSVWILNSFYLWMFYALEHRDAHIEDIKEDATHPASVIPTLLDDKKWWISAFHQYFHLHSILRSLMMTEPYP